MKILIPVDVSQVALAPIDHVASLANRGVKVEALVLNVQPHFPQYIARFTNKADRDSLRAERSSAAMASTMSNPPANCRRGISPVLTVIAVTSVSSRRRTLLSPGPTPTTPAARWPAPVSS